MIPPLPAGRCNIRHSFGYTSAMRAGFTQLLFALAAVLVTAGALVAQTTQPAVPASGKAVVIRADGQVDDFYKNSIMRRYREAKELGADAIILQIDTYGGLVITATEITRFIKQADVPIHAFVDEKAISAGSMIALSCKSIAMEPASMIGDSGVIAMGQQLEGTDRAKAESPVFADFDDSARRNGYSPLLARTFVETVAAVYVVEPIEGDGEMLFVDKEQYETLTAEGGGYRDLPDVPVPLDSETSLLTVSNVVAEKINLSVGTFVSPEAFAESMGYTVMATLEPSTGERTVGLLSSFTVRGLLMTLLFLSVYTAFSSPGTGFPEAIAAVLIGVLFGIPFLTGFAEWYEVLFVVLGLILLAVEVFVIPGFGVFGLTGLVSILMGLSLTFVGPISTPGMPSGYGVDWSQFMSGLLLTAAAMVVSLLLWMWLARFLPHLPYANRMILEDAPLSEQAKINAAAWPAVGTIGVAAVDIRPGGTATFSVTDAPDDTTIIDVITDRGFIAAGTSVHVTEAAGNRIVVRPQGEQEVM